LWEQFIAGLAKVRSSTPLSGVKPMTQQLQQSKLLWENWELLSLPTLR
jgi:hypothetical protein